MFASGCFKNRSWYCTCCNGYTRMFQMHEYVSLNVSKVDQVLHLASGWRRLAYRKALAPTSRLPRVARLALTSPLPPLPFPSLCLAMVVWARPDFRTDKGWAMGNGRGTRDQLRASGTRLAAGNKVCLQEMHVGLHQLLFYLVLTPFQITKTFYFLKLIHCFYYVYLNMVYI